ncbi:MAG: hypothetical protein U0414_24000 [Polyangiaceae bacterium]
MGYLLRCGWGSRLMLVAFAAVVSSGCSDSKRKPPAFTGSTSASGSGATSSGSGNSTSASSGAGGGGGGPSGTLSKVLEGAPWTVGQRTTGIAVDNQGIVFVMDDSNVYAVQGSTVGVYLTLDELDAIVGTPHAGFKDLDRDPSGAIYVLAPVSLSSTGTLFKLTGPHAGEVVASLPELGQMEHLAIRTADFMGFIRYAGGFWTLEGGAMKEVYSGTDIGDGTGCATEDLAMQASGVFLYQVGCNGSPLVRASALGGAPDTIQPKSFANASNFVCSARDPAGGFYVMASPDLADATASLVHADEDFALPAGIQTIVTHPSINSAAQSEGNLVFRYCSMAVSKAGTVFIQSFDQLWKLEL